MLKILSVNKKELPFKSWIFNGGETGFSLEQETIDKIKSSGFCQIISYLKSNNDLIELCHSVDAINRIFKGCYIDLRIPYILGGRQDRVSNEGEAFSLKLYADIINSLRVDKLEIVDPHSDVTPAILDNCEIYPIEDIIKQVIEDCRPDIIIIPDAGAAKRVEKLFSLINTKRYVTTFEDVNYNPPMVQCLKKRDTKTGKLTGFRVFSTFEEMKNKRCLVVDDLCDGGGTFLGLADTLNAMGISELYLYVTHGIFSQGYDKLALCYSKIYTTDSFQSDYNPIGLQDRVKIFSLYGDN